MPIKIKTLFKRRVSTLQQEKDKLEAELKQLKEEAAALVTTIVKPNEKSSELKKEVEERKNVIEEKIRRISQELEQIDTVAVQEVHQITNREVSQIYKYSPLLFLLPIIVSIIYFIIDKFFL